MIHINAQGACCEVIVRLPQGAQNQMPIHQHVHILAQHQQQVVLPRRQVLTAHGLVNTVKVHAAEVKLGFLRACARTETPQNSLNLAYQYFNGQGFNHIIVTSQFVCAVNLAERIALHKHDNRQLVARLAQVAQRVKTIVLGHVRIHKTYITAVSSQFCQTVFSVRCRQHLISALAQIIGKDSRYVDIIVTQKNMCFRSSDHITFAVNYITKTVPKVAFFSHKYQNCEKNHTFLIIICIYHYFVVLLRVE